MVILRLIVSLCLFCSSPSACLYLFCISFIVTLCLFGVVLHHFMALLSIFCGDFVVALCLFCIL